MNNQFTYGMGITYQKQCGYTLFEGAIEILIVIFLAAIILPAYWNYESRERFIKVISVVEQIKSSVNRYIQEHGESMDLQSTNNWNALGLSGPPALPKEMSRISLSASGVISVDVAPGVAGSDPCQITYTRNNAVWAGVTNCPKPVSTLVKECQEDGACTRAEREPIR
jgi:Tfp pilus assembly protein PilE